MPDKYRIVV